MDNEPKIEIKSNRHFKMLAVLVVAIGIFQTAFLDHRRVSHVDMQAYKDTIVALTTAVTSYEGAKTRQLVKQEINDLDDAILENVLVPLTAIDKRLTKIDSLNKKGLSENAILINYQLTRIRQIVERTDSFNLNYRVYPKQF